MTEKDKTINLVPFDRENEWAVLHTYFYEATMMALVDNAEIRFGKKSLKFKKGSVVVKVNKYRYLHDPHDVTYRQGI